MFYANFSYIKQWNVFKVGHYVTLPQIKHHVKFGLHRIIKTRKLRKNVFLASKKDRKGFACEL